jgi:glucokinase
MEWASEIRTLVSRISDEQKAPPICIGISAPGLAAKDQGSIACMPGRLSGLTGLNWTEFLGHKQFIPVINDAHAALLGESWLGAARSFQNVFMLTLGTGVGGAALVDGRLLTGHIGRGGHLGHICLDPAGSPDVTGMPGSLEDAIGNWTINVRGGGRFATTHDLVAAYVAGDSTAARIWLESIRKLACGIASLINVLDPEAVIIGGGIARSGKALFDPLQKELDRIEWRPLGSGVKVVPAQLGELAGAYGAAFNALGRQ